MLASYFVFQHVCWQPTKRGRSKMACYEDVLFPKTRFLHASHSHLSCQKLCGYVCTRYTQMCATSNYLKGRRSFCRKFFVIHSAQAWLYKSLNLVILQLFVLEKMGYKKACETMDELKTYTSGPMKKGNNVSSDMHFILISPLICVSLDSSSQSTQ